MSGVSKFWQAAGNKATRPFGQETVAHKRSRSELSRRGRTQDRNHECTWWGEDQNQCRTRLEGRCRRRRRNPHKEKANILAPPLQPEARVRGVDRGCAKAWRAVVRKVRAVGLWRDVWRQVNQVPREQHQQENQKAIPGGIHPTDAEHNPPTGGKEEKWRKIRSPRRCWARRGK